MGTSRDAIGAQVLRHFAKQVLRIRFLTTGLDLGKTTLEAMTRRGRVHPQGAPGRG